MVENKLLASSNKRLKLWPMYVLWYATGAKDTGCITLAELCQRANVCPVIAALMSRFYHNQQLCQAPPRADIYNFDPAGIIDTAADDSLTTQRLMDLTNVTFSDWYPRLSWYHPEISRASCDTLRTLVPFRTRSDIEVLTQLLCKYAPAYVADHWRARYSQFSQLPMLNAALLLTEHITNITSAIHRHLHRWHNPHGEVQDFLCVSVWPLLWSMVHEARPAEPRPKHPDAHEF